MSIPEGFIQEIWSVFWTCSLWFEVYMSACQLAWVDYLFTVFVTINPILKTKKTHFQCRKNLGTYLWPKSILVDLNFNIFEIILVQEDCFLKCSYASYLYKIYFCHILNNFYIIEYLLCRKWWTFCDLTNASDWKVRSMFYSQCYVYC